MKVSIWHSNLVYRFSTISVINRWKSLDCCRFLSIDYSGYNDMKTISPKKLELLNFVAISNRTNLRDLKDGRPPILLQCFLQK